MLKERKSLATNSLLKPVPLPPGEDETSYSRNQSILISESKKNKPNPTVINSLMKLTFPFRRNKILQESNDLKEILSVFPYLKNTKQVSIETITIITDYSYVLI